MKKLITFLVVLALSVGSIAAQSFSAQVEAGLNVSKLTDINSRCGFNVGVRGELGLPYDLYLNAGLFLTMKGAKEDIVTIDAYGFELPIHVGFKHHFGNAIAVFVDLGPYFNIGAFGKTKVKVENVEASEDTYGKNGLKRFDFGLGARAGVEILNKFPIAIGYDFGLVDVADIDGEDIKNGNFTLSVGYKF